MQFKFIMRWKEGQPMHKDWSGLDGDCVWMEYIEQLLAFCNYLSKLLKEHSMRNCNETLNKVIVVNKTGKIRDLKTKQRKRRVEI